MPLSGGTSVPIRVDVDGDLPLYLQIKYQLSYLISTEKLRSGARLPAVRNLARELGINFHTVAQAYRELQAEGLIESAAGRGSFVRQFSDVDRVKAVRQERLSEVLQEAREKARALGFNDAEILQRLASINQQYQAACHIAFVDRVPHTAAKYARLLELHLNGAVRATPLTMEEIQARGPRARETLSRVFYVVTVARNVPPLEAVLPEFGEAHNIVTIVAEVLPETTRALAAVDPGTRAVMLTEEHYLYSSLNLVALHSDLDPATVEAFTPDDAGKFQRAAREAGLVLYTFGVSGQIDELARSQAGLPERRLELAFDIGGDSIAKLRELFGVQEQVGAGAG